MNAPPPGRPAHPSRPQGLAPLTSDDPDRMGPFRLVGRLGAGGMGVVYGALDAHGAPVAVKTVHGRLAADAAFRARFAREVALVGRVESVCTPRFVDADVDGPLPWMASEYVPGRTLRQHVRAQGPLSGGVLTAFAAGVAEALRAVHAQGVVHRDLKPGNVVLSPSGPKVLDFGIARALGETALTRTGGLMGTPGWIAPELYAGADPGPAADMFAWGALVAFAATGRDPFGRGEADAVAFRTVEEAADTEGVPADLLPLVSAALDKDPARRPDAGTALAALVRPTRAGEGAGSAGEDPAAEATRLLPDLLGATWSAGAGAGTDVSTWAADPGRYRRRPRRPRGRPVLAAVAAVTAVVTVAGLGWFAGEWWGGRDTGTGAGGTGSEGAEDAAASGVEEPPLPETDRGGINLVEPGDSGAVVDLESSGANSVQLHGVVGWEEGAPEDRADYYLDSDVYAALTFTSAEARDGAVVVEAEGTYAHGTGDLVVHGQDFRAHVYAPGAFSGPQQGTPEPEVFAPEEDEVLLVLSPEQTTGTIRLTFEGLAQRSLLEYTIPAENLNGVEPLGQGLDDPLIAHKCVNTGDEEGPGVAIAYQAGDCDPGWV